MVVYGEQQQQQQQQNQRLTTLDYVIEELKRNNNTKIDPYDLLSGFIVYLQQEQNMRNPNYHVLAQASTQEDILYIQVERCICSFPLDQVSEYLRSDQLIGTILNIDDLPFCANLLLLSQLFP
jgi:hypothetical protein